MTDIMDRDPGMANLNDDDYLTVTHVLEGFKLPDGRIIPIIIDEVREHIEFLRKFPKDGVFLCQTRPFAINKVRQGSMLGLAADLKFQNHTYRYIIEIPVSAMDSLRSSQSIGIFSPYGDLLSAIDLRPSMDEMNTVYKQLIFWEEVHSKLGVKDGRKEV